MSDHRKYWNLITYQTRGVMWCDDKNFAEALFDRLAKFGLNGFVLFTRYHVEFTPDTYSDNYRYVKYPNVDAFLSFKKVPAEIRNKFVSHFIKLAKEWKTTNQSGSGSSQSLPSGSEL